MMQDTMLMMLTMTAVMVCSIQYRLSLVFVTSARYPELGRLSFLLLQKRQTTPSKKFIYIAN